MQRATVFAEALGAQFETLPEPVQAAHAAGPELCLRGRAQVAQGAGWWERGLARLFRLPQAGQDIPVRVTKIRGASGEIWQRDFGGHRFRSYLDCDQYGARERLGLVTFRLRLKVVPQGLSIEVAGARVGPIPVPRLLLPVSDSVERAEAGRFQFDIALYAPMSGRLIVRYRGWLVPD